MQENTWYIEHKQIFIFPKHKSKLTNSTSLIASNEAIFELQIHKKKITKQMNHL